MQSYAFAKLLAGNYAVASSAALGSCAGVTENPVRSVHADTGAAEKLLWHHQQLAAALPASSGRGVLGAARVGGPVP